MIQSVGWLAWSFLCAFVVKAIWTRFLRRQLFTRASLGAYALLTATFIATLAIVSLSGGIVYGDRTGSEQLSFWLYYYSPIGLPLAFGTPFIVLFDVIAMLAWCLGLSKTQTDI